MVTSKESDILANKDILDSLIMADRAMDSNDSSSLAVTSSLAFNSKVILSSSAMLLNNSAAESKVVPNELAMLSNCSPEFANKALSEDETSPNVVAGSTPSAFNLKMASTTKEPPSVFTLRSKSNSLK